MSRLFKLPTEIETCNQCLYSYVSYFNPSASDALYCKLIPDRLNHCMDEPVATPDKCPLENINK